VDTTNFYSQGEYSVKTTFASDPLVRIAGTGLSGSVGGLNPEVVAYELPGQYAISGYPGNPVYACNSIANKTIFSSTGVLENSAVLYFDAYGVTPLTGYDWIVDYNTCEVFSINPATAVATDTGYTCAYYGYPCL
jgi:hypothetical protein